MDKKEMIMGMIRLGRTISVIRCLPTDRVDEKLYKTSSLRGHISNTQTYSSIRVCDYEHLAIVQDERANGKEKQRPQWWHWQEGQYPYFAKHNSKGTEYLVVKTQKNTHIKSEYFVDGQKTLKRSIQEHFKATNPNIGRVIHIPLDEIVAINGVVLK